MIKNSRVLKYIISGSLAVLTEYTAFVGLSFFISKYYANPISFVGGLFVSYYLNNKWTFRARNYHLSKYRRLITYVTLGLINILLSAIYYAIISSTLNGYLAKALSMMLIAIGNYFIFSRHIFKGSV